MTGTALPAAAGTNRQFGISTQGLPPGEERSPLSLLSGEDVTRLARWNATAVAYPRDATLVQLFEEQVARTPEQVALRFEGAVLTFAQLERRANQLAHHLRSLGVGQEDLVGVSVPRSLDMVVALLGILKAGGAYLPLDPAYPAERLAFMLEDAAPRALVTTRGLLKAFPLHQATDICLDRDAASIEQRSDRSPGLGVPADAIAYALYTSGSTGKPKGVLGVHRAAVNRFAWMWNAYPFHSDEVCCQKTTLNFVDSVWEVFGPLLCGVPNVVLPEDDVKDPHRLVEALAAHRVTRIVLVPSLLRALLATHGDLATRLPGLRHWICSGEALPLDVCRRFYEVLPNAMLLNLYGSSEVAADVSYFDTRELTPEMSSVPIGRPIANTQLHVLDDAQRVVPIGVAGELYVGGVGLARGYLRRPELTLEKFVPSPFDPVLGDRLYRTGDQARWREDGTLEYLGRLDQQVKLRGMRIELGEIEAALLRQPGVHEAVVMLRTGGVAPRLVAYVVGDAAATSDASHLRARLQAILPAHMVPAAFVALPQLPLTPNGKVDRNALPEPDEHRPQGDRDRGPAPAHGVEQRLAGIWQELLRVDRVSAEDDFFELGGDSLIAVQLFTRIEQTFSKRLPLATLVQAPTLAELADLIGPEGTVHSWSSLVPIQAEGSRVPIFCTHGAGANVLDLRVLARHLGPDQPFFGLQSQGLDGATAPYERIEDMAAHYIREIRAVRPQGPYVLAGFSMGGIVAFEMAQQLRAAGQQVGGVLLIDTQFPAKPIYILPWNPLQAALYPWLGVLEYHFAAVPRLGLKGYLWEWWLWLYEGTKRRIARVAKRLSPQVTLQDWDAPDALKQVVAANFRAERNYQPQVYPGPLVLFWSNAPNIGHPDTRLAWEQVAGEGLQIYVVPGDHNSLRDEPNVQVFAAKLRTYLERMHSTLNNRGREGHDEYAH